MGGATLAAVRPAGRRAWDDGVAMEGGGGRGRWRRRGAVASAWDDGVAWRRRPESRATTEAPTRAQRRRRDHGGRHGPGQCEAAARREACWGGGAQGRGTGRRRRGGRSERVADGNRDESRGGRRTTDASLDYRESLRYRVKSKTGT